jgi:hypothetical protein
MALWLYGSMLPAHELSTIVEPPRPCLDLARGAADSWPVMRGEIGRNNVQISPFLSILLDSSILFPT